MQKSVDIAYRVCYNNYALRETSSCHCGDDSVGDPPVLIPNTEVKPYCADGTCLATDRESRKLPHFIKSCLVYAKQLFLLL